MKRSVLFLWGLVFIINLFAFADFTMPSGYLKEKDISLGHPEEYICHSNNKDILSHHVRGTWIVYEDVIVDTQDGEYGYLSSFGIRLFSWNNFAAETLSPLIEVDSDSTGILENKALDMDASSISGNDELYVAALVVYWTWDALHKVAARNKILTYRYDISDDEFIYSPNIERDKLAFESIGDVTIVTESDGDTYIYWTETEYENSTYEYFLFWQERGGSPLGDPESIFLGESGSSYDLKLDATFDYGTDETYIAVECPPGTSFKLYCKDLSDDDPFHLVTVSSAKNPSIDSYSWNSSRDFVVAYEKTTDGVAFRKYASGSIGSENVKSTESDAVDPCIICYTWGSNSTDWANNSTEIITWNQSGYAYLSRKTGATEDNNIILANSSVGNHDSYTPDTKEPLISCISPTSCLIDSTNCLGGFFAVWHDPYTGMPVDTAYIWGKHSNNVPFRTMTIEDDNVQGYIDDTPSDSSPLTVYLETFEGYPLEEEKVQFEYQYYKTGESFQQGDQVYYSKVSYEVEDLLDPYNIKLQVNVLSGKSQFPGDNIREVSSTGTYSDETTGYWNFWQYFPDDDGKEYLGFFFNHYGTMYCEAEIDNDGERDQPKLDLKFIDWTNADAIDCDEGEDITCPYVATCDDVLDKNDFPGTTTDKVSCLSGSSIVGHWLQILIPGNTEATITMSALSGCMGGLGLYVDCDDFPSSPHETSCGYTPSVDYTNSSSSQIAIYVLANYHQCEDPTITISCE